MTQDNSYFSNDQFAKFLGIQLIESRADYTRCELNLSEQHKNSFGSVHGAVIFALASCAFANACNTDATSIGLQADIKYLNKMTGTRLIAETEIVSATKRMGAYQVRISDNDGQVIAIYSALSQRVAASKP